MPSQEGEVTILHFNDCYNVESQMHEPVGGATRFCSAIKSFADLEPLTVFSGDIVAPSIMSTFTKGEQMIGVLNSVGVDCACYGNHDFDFGVDNLIDFARQTHFPWLISNVFDIETNQPLADGNVMWVTERAGKKLGFVGLVEEEWLATLSTIDPDDVNYVDFVSEGRKLAKHLKDKEGVDYVIALTHMRTPNDCRLAENVDEIDLILGGHDHVYEVKKVNDKHIIKSGTDFRQFSKITLTFNHTTVDVRIEEINVTAEYNEDEELKQHLEKYRDVVEGKMDEVLGHFAVDLDGRFSSVRTQETNLGNFICDIMLSATHSDLAILNSGTLRSDRVHPKGPFTLRDLVTVLPMMDSLVVLSASGEKIVRALENGVSQYPKLEGRFLQVSGITFAFDPTKPPGCRLDPSHIKVGDEMLDLNQEYRLVTKNYLYQGRDGFEILKDCKVLMGEDESPGLCTAVQNHFQAIKILTGSAYTRSRHRQSLVCLSRRHSIVKMHDESSSHVTPCHPSIRRGMSLDITGSRGHMLVRQSSLESVEQEQCRLEPKTEGRILLATDQVKERFQQGKEDLACSLVEEIIEEEDASPE